MTITLKRETISFNRDRVHYITVPGKPSNDIFKHFSLKLERKTPPTNKNKTTKKIF